MRLHNVFFTFLLFLMQSLMVFHYADCETWMCGDTEGDLMHDLMIVDSINRKLNDRLPVTYNHLLYGGYINMPSARMGKAGEIAFGYAFAPPYRIYSLRCQLLENLELSGNYRIFRGIPDPVLSQHGFGDFSDKGANVKIALLHPEDSHYQLPGIAIGFDDVLGTKEFQSKYLVFTQVFLNQNLEVSVGYGAQRIKRWFGGAIWMPWRTSENCWLQGMALVTEYDANDYTNPHREPHPKGRVVNSRLNYGIKYRLFDYFDFSSSFIRGKEWAWSASASYNFGETEGFLPKVDDPLPYTSPVNVEPIGYLRPEQVAVQDLLYALDGQGFDLLEAILLYNTCNQKILRIKVYNRMYLLENDVRSQLTRVLANLTPSDLYEVIVLIESEGFPIQQYRFYNQYLKGFRCQDLCEYELDLLSPMQEVIPINHECSSIIFKRQQERYCIEALPKTYTLFGSSKGKFKYTLGINVGVSGYIWNDVYYQFMLGWLPISNLKSSSAVDILNPSQLINVHTDVIKYYQQTGITFDAMYLQKNWNIGKGFYSKVTLGYFDQQYAGLGTEWLYYPVDSPWAIGIEISGLRKRKLTGLGLTSTIRKFDGFIPTYQKFHGSQYFLDLYYDWRHANLDFQVSIGKFLANDRGIRYEVSRYFPNGLRIFLWYTVTNAHDIVNNHVYHDKGIGFSMPLDIFFTCSNRERWGYGMSAWLRDCGFRTFIGETLFDLINESRQ